MSPSVAREEPATKPKLRILSGIQPSGELHLGNYLGAIREHVRLQEGADAYYFVADFHALTSVRDAERLRKSIRATAVTYLSCGLDPARAVLFRQSDVPEICEIMWLLLSVCPMAMLENAVSYKDKVARGVPADAGLFTYPILMAADIVAQDSDVVPVGKDQVQHVEITRDVIQRFNRHYGVEALKTPDYRLGVAPYVPGTDGQKMSKSYDNTIPIRSDGKDLEKIVMGIKTDSKGVQDAKDPETCNVFRIFSLVASSESSAALAERYRAGGMGYGDAKKLLLAELRTLFAPIEEKRRYWEAHPSDVDDVLAAGAKKARANAATVLQRARRACGID